MLQPNWYGLRSTRGRDIELIPSAFYQDIDRNLQEGRQDLDLPFTTHLRIGDEFSTSVLFRITSNGVEWLSQEHWSAVLDKDENLTLPLINPDSADRRARIDKIVDSLRGLSEKLLWPVLLPKDHPARAKLSLVLVMGSPWGKCWGVWALHATMGSPTALDVGVATQAFSEREYLHLYRLTTPAQQSLVEVVLPPMDKQSIRHTTLTEAEMFYHCLGLAPESINGTNLSRRDDQLNERAWHIYSSLRGQALPARYRAVYDQALEYISLTKRGERMPLAQRHSGSTGLFEWGKVLFLTIALPDPPLRVLLAKDYIATGLKLVEEVFVTAEALEHPGKAALDSLRSLRIYTAIQQWAQHHLIALNRQSDSPPSTEMLISFFSYVVATKGITVKMDNTFSHAGQHSLLLDIEDVFEVVTNFVAGARGIPLSEPEDEGERRSLVEVLQQAFTKPASIRLADEMLRPETDWGWSTNA